MRKYQDRYSICRNCNHNRDSHSIYIQLLEGLNQSKYIQILEEIPCNIIMDYAPSPNKYCNCKNFEPTDNLEYLEMKYEEKNKEKSN
jgi:hypothetical protein